eukprot:evm.model.NODE_39505_length_72863_cov_22.203917.21
MSNILTPLSQRRLLAVEMAATAYDDDDDDDDPAAAAHRPPPPTGLRLTDCIKASPQP